MNTDHRPQHIDRYPAEMIVGIIPAYQVDALINALGSAGIAADAYDVASGPIDGQRLAVATDHGVRGALRRLLGASEEGQHLERYIAELRAGETVMRVHVQNEAQKREIADLYAAHGGRFVNYYGQWTVEELIPE